MPVCYLQKKLTLNTFQILDKTSKSNSILLLFPDQEKVVKLTTANVNNDNSLQLERDMYDKIGTNLVVYSPHFLTASKVGSCSDAYIMSLKGSKDITEAKLYKQWAKLRTNALLIHMKANPTSEWNSFMKSIPTKIRKNSTDLRKYLVSEKTPLKYRTHFNQVYFVETNQMKGIPLFDFLTQNDLQLLPSDTLTTIVTQIAQALSVLAMFKIMHNDLHLNNIYIKTCQEPKTVEYFYPKHSKIVTQNFVTIFDWDRSFDEQTGVPNELLENTDLCESIGSCNKYIAKYDWYTLLTGLVYTLDGDNKICGMRELQRILGNLYDEGPSSRNKTNVGHDAFLGHPCTCEKTRNKKAKGDCTLCKRKSISKLTTPRTYFDKHVSIIKPRRRLS